MTFFTPENGSEPLGDSEQIPPTTIANNPPKTTVFERVVKARYADKLSFRSDRSNDSCRVSMHYEVSWLTKIEEENEMRLFGWIKSLFSRPITQGELMQAEGTILTEDKVKKFIDTRLGGQDLPKDLSSLMTAIAGNPEFEKSGDNPLKIIRAEALWTDRKYPLLDHDYINDVDRANPDIMANVRAMQDTDKKLKFVVQCEDTSLIGYWQPDPETPLEQCALFWLDTEGQYYLAEGKTLSESLAYRALVEGNEDTYRSLRDAFERLGVTVPKGDETSIFADMDVRSTKIGETPKTFRNQRYEYYGSL